MSGFVNYRDDLRQRAVRDPDHQVQLSSKIRFCQLPNRTCTESFTVLAA